MGTNLPNLIFNMHALAITFCSIALFAVSTNSVPPSACLANFRWEDCGRDPEPKMYYWKPGSRCEVGIWRGCLPSLNMFRDEYECVSTCIFSVRAQPSDYHNKQQMDGNDDDYDVSDEETTTFNDTETTTLFESATTLESMDNSTFDNNNTENTNNESNAETTAADESESADPATIDNGDAVTTEAQATEAQNEE